MEAPRHGHAFLAALVASLAAIAATSRAPAQEPEPYLGAPIHYEDDRRSDAVARLEGALAEGAVTPAFDAQRGWLPALLAAFDIPLESQVLVFSKTSLQADRISPATPRALYFGDEVVVGWIPGSPIMEVTALDPTQGPTFYALPQSGERPAFERRDDSCLACHASPRTAGWPGHVIRSVHPDSRGFPILRAGTYRTTQASPLEERWGGWYVTGSHGDQRHMGNVTVAGASEQVDRDAGANVLDLTGRFDLSRYPSPHSDIVALMVLEHQCEMQNLIARASYETRRALDYQRVLNGALGEPAEHVSESTTRRLQRAAEDLVDHLLFKGEAPLSGPIRGTSGFAEAFMARGVRDRAGRSLRDLDLERRLMRWPCSYLVHSAAFRALPAALRSAVWSDLGAILRGDASARVMPHLSEADRFAIREHLTETVEGLPAGF